MKYISLKHEHSDCITLTNKDISDDTIKYIIGRCRNYPKSFVLFYLPNDEEIKKVSKRVLYGIGNELNSISFSEILFSNGSLILFKVENEPVNNRIICVK